MYVVLTDKTLSIMHHTSNVIFIHTTLLQDTALKDSKETVLTGKVGSVTSIGGSSHM